LDIEEWIVGTRRALYISMHGLASQLFLIAPYTVMSSVAVDGHDSSESC